MFLFVLIIWVLLNNGLNITEYILIQIDSERYRHLIQKLEYIFLGTAVIATHIMLSSIRFHLRSEYVIFCILYLVYIALEALYYFFLKKVAQQKWYLFIPYVIIFLLANYGLCTMIWWENTIWGIVASLLLAGQIMLSKYGI